MAAYITWAILEGLEGPEFSTLPAKVEQQVTGSRTAYGSYTPILMSDIMTILGVQDTVHLLPYAVNVTREIQTNIAIAACRAMLPFFNEIWGTIWCDEFIKLVIRFLSGENPVDDGRTTPCGDPVPGPPPLSETSLLDEAELVRSLASNRLSTAGNYIFHVAAYVKDPFWPADSNLGFYDPAEGFDPALSRTDAYRLADGITTDAQISYRDQAAFEIASAVADIAYVATDGYGLAAIIAMLIRAYRNIYHHIILERQLVLIDLQALANRGALINPARINSPQVQAVYDAGAEAFDAELTSRGFPNATRLSFQVLSGTEFTFPSWSSIFAGMSRYSPEVTNVVGELVFAKDSRCTVVKVRDLEAPPEDPKEYVWSSSQSFHTNIYGALQMLHGNPLDSSGDGFATKAEIVVHFHAATAMLKPARIAAAGPLWEAAEESYEEATEDQWKTDLLKDAILPYLA